MSPTWGEGPHGGGCVVLPKYESAGDAGNRLFWQLVLQILGYHQGDLYVTPWDKSSPIDDREDERRKRNNDDLLRIELDDVKPAWVMAVGKEAAEFFGCPAMDLGHGLMFDFTGVPVIPVYHPGAALKDSKRLAFTVNDLKAVQWKQYEVGAWQPDLAPRDYQIWDGWNDHMMRWDRVAIDTEYEGTDPLCLTFSTKPNMGRLIPVSDTLLLKRFNHTLKTYKPVITLHNALADIEPLKRMGIDVVKNSRGIEDTMVYAWYKETERQGLKPLAYRHLGVDRPGFKDVVTPYYSENLKAYMVGAKMQLEPKEFERRGKPTKANPEGKLLKPGIEPSTPLYRLAKRFLGDLEKGAIEDFEKRWDGWSDENKAELKQLCGPPPVYSLRCVPMDKMLPYACADADDTFRLAPILAPKYDDIKQCELADKDHRKIPMISAMQERGLRVDMTARDWLLADLNVGLAQYKEQLVEMTGLEDFNPNSPIDVAKVLYGYFEDEDGVGKFLDDKEYIAIDSKAWTKAGKPKTDKKTLARIKGQSAIPSVLMKYKEMEKLKGTYVEPLPDLCRAEMGFMTLHPNFAHTRVPSGRLAARRPNVMAIPSRTDLGKRVRGMFVSRPGYSFVGFDHSQIELCMAAHVSNDHAMTQVLKSGRDFHAATASEISGRPYEDCLKDKLFRGLFKTINYGILFGATAPRIHMELLSSGITTYTQEDCERARNDWFTLYWGIKQEIENTAEFLAKHGYVEDMWGRRRQLPGGQLRQRTFPFSALREEAIRQGFNLKVQGGAQGLLINAMIEFWEVVMPRYQEDDIFPVLQVHDELIFEVKDQVVEEFMADGLAVMQKDQPMFEVPILSSGSHAKSWDGLK